MKHTELQGNLVVEGQKFAVVVSRFNEFITGKLLTGALDALERHGANPKNITVVRVPGSFELPATANKCARSKRFDAVVCLGCLIRGQTPHFDVIAAEAAKGIAHVGLETGVPVTFGVITADTLEQAIERAGSKAGNKGADAAVTAIELFNLYRQLEGTK
ncbi:MAG: 6,7-dimethyl-8-ribityllumazine synthase [bacterium]|nr:6,7-dimethyl-8-ribityllumazine synthase [bacterium]